MNKEWTEHWVGMPEFQQEKHEPYSTLNIRFETKEDMEEFAEMIGQKLIQRTKSIWHPQLVRGQHSAKRYISDES